MSTFAVERPIIPGVRESEKRSMVVVLREAPVGWPRAFISALESRASSPVHQGLSLGFAESCGLSAWMDGTRTGEAWEGSPIPIGVPRSPETTTKGRGRLSRYFSYRWFAMTE